MNFVASNVKPEEFAAGRLGLSGWWPTLLRRASRWQLPDGFRKSASSECGAAMVEFALSAVIMLMLLIGIIEMCLAFYTYNFVSNAAREAARYAIVRGSTSCTNTPALANCNATADEISGYVNSVGYPSLSSNNLTVTTTWLTATSSGSPATTTWTACSSGVCNVPGNLVKVVATYNFLLGIPYIPRSTLAISSSSAMVIAQ